MSDPNEDFENYLRQFRLRPSDPRALFSRPAIRLRGWWISGGIAAIAAIAVIAVVKTQTPVPEIERPAAAPAAASPPVSTPAPAYPASPEPAPRTSRRPTSKPKAAAPEPASATVGRFQTPPAENRGQKIFERVCSACHDLDAANTLHLATRGDYESYVAMKRAKGAQVTDEEFPVLVDYLFQRFRKK